jgi:hypothetical protein
VSTPFRRSGSLVRVRLSDEERAILASVPAIISDAGDAGGRFDYRAHADDAEAEGRYRDLIAGSLETMRAEDREQFLCTLGEASIDLETAEAWMRVIGDARLVLAGRLGIEEDGWEESTDPATDPDVALITYLGFIQDELVTALS